MGGESNSDWALLQLKAALGRRLAPANHRLRIVLDFVCLRGLSSEACVRAQV